MKKKLIRLGRWLAARHPTAVWRACVDTAPVLEREWAARAGIGWIGTAQVPPGEAVIVKLSMNEVAGRTSGRWMTPGTRPGRL